MIELVFNFIKSAISVIAKAGRAVFNFAQNLATKIPPIATKITRVAQAIVTIGKALNLAKEGDSAREFGLKIQQDNVRNRMDDEPMSEYMSYLRDDVPLDNERLKKLSEQEAMECDLIGTSMFRESIKENTGMCLSPDFLNDWEKTSMDTEHLAEYVKEFCRHGLDSMDPLFSYLDGALEDDGVIGQVKESIAAGEQNLNPEMSTVDAMSLAENMMSSLDQISINKDEYLGLGLTPNEKSFIKAKTGWSDCILDCLGSLEEAEIYLKAGLKESNVGGHPALIRQDIRWSDFSCRHEWLKEKLAEPERWDNYNNADLIGEGFPPRDANGDPYELHHIGQKQDSPYAELTWAEHMGGGNNIILHKAGKPSEIDRIEFQGEKSQYWMDRYAMFSESELKEIYQNK